MAEYQLLDYITMEETALSSIAAALSANETWDDALEAEDNETASNGTDASPFPIYRHSTAITIVYCLGYLIVFVLGLIGNCLVVAVVFRCPRMRSVTNFFIVNLAIADILVVLFCLPATLLSNIFVPWVLGGAMCKMVTYVQGVSVVASVDSLVAVSLDRFLAICFPMKFQITTRRARIVLLVIWILALTTSIPWSMYFQLESVFPSHPDVQLCVEKWPSVYEEHVYFIVANVIFCYLLPLFLILLCYVMIWIRVWSRSIPTENNDAHMERLQQRSKVKVIKMLVVVVVVFSLSWLPLYLIFTRIKLGGEISQWEDLVLSIATPIAQWLGASNSCINPILYAYFNQKYRRAFAAIIQSRSCCASIRLEEDRSLYRSVVDNHRAGTRCQRQVSTVSHIDGATEVFRTSKHMAISSGHRGVNTHEIPLTVIDRSMI